jgi:hypothetical protein
LSSAASGMVVDGAAASVIPGTTSGKLVEGGAGHRASGPRG